MKKKKLAFLLVCLCCVFLILPGTGRAESKQVTLYAFGIQLHDANGSSLYDDLALTNTQLAEGIQVTISNDLTTGPDDFLFFVFYDGEILPFSLEDDSSLLWEHSVSLAATSSTTFLIKLPPSLIEEKMQMGKPIRFAVVAGQNLFPTTNEEIWLPNSYEIHAHIVSGSNEATILELPLWQEEQEIISLIPTAVQGEPIQLQNIMDVPQKSLLVDFVIDQATLDYFVLPIINGHFMLVDEQPAIFATIPGSQPVSGQMSLQLQGGKNTLSFVLLPVDENVRSVHNDGPKLVWNVKEE